MEHAIYQPHSPWKKFTDRRELTHLPEDDVRLCTPGQTSAQIIERFLVYEELKIHIDELVPRRRQVLRDFLNEVTPIFPRGIGPYLQDIERYSKDDHIALVDDRQNHEGCVNKNPIKRCDDCIIYSRSVSIPELCVRLQEKVYQPWL